MVAVSKKKTQETARKIIYPVEGETSVAPHMITPEIAKNLLGWQITEDKEFFVKDQEGNKVQCVNNMKNRPLYLSVVDILSQEILNGRWKFNGESIIVGKTGVILNGQHTLVALVFASQMVKKGDLTPDQEKAWAGKGEADVTIRKAIMYGVEEDDNTVNTMDTCKPRTLADVIFRSEHFKKFKGAERKNASRALDYAIRTVWARTGTGLDADAPHRTHAEAIDFLNRHSSLCKAVKFIIGENGTANHIANRIGLGYASALLYLMGVSKTDWTSSKYESKRKESVCDFDNWDRAEEFWIVVNTAGSPLSKSINDALASLGTSPSLREKICVFILAWQNFLEKKEGKKIQLVLKEIDTDVFVLDEDHMPTIGGIDLGDEKVLKHERQVEELERKKEEEEAKEQDPKKKFDAAKLKEKQAQVEKEEKSATKEKHKKKLLEGWENKVEAKKQEEAELEEDKEALEIDYADDEQDKEGDEAQE